MWRFIQEFIEAARAFMAQGYGRPVQYPTFEETAAILGPRYREIETPFGTIGYLGSLELPGGDMGASWEFSFDR